MHRIINVGNEGVQVSSRNSLYSVVITLLMLVMFNAVSAADRKPEIVLEDKDSVSQPESMYSTIQESKCFAQVATSHKVNVLKLAGYELEEVSVQLWRYKDPRVDSQLARAKNRGPFVHVEKTIFDRIGELTGLKEKSQKPKYGKLRRSIVLKFGSSNGDDLVEFNCGLVQPKQR